MEVLNSGNSQVMTWNANSVSPKKHELFDFLMSGSIDIVLINVTYLKQGVSFSHPDYKCYRLDRSDRPKGGIVILVCQDVLHMLLSFFRMWVLECIGVSVVTASG
jgi:hypothetical protein